MLIHWCTLQKVSKTESLAFSMNSALQATRKKSFSRTLGGKEGGRFNKGRVEVMYIKEDPFRESCQPSLRPIVTLHIGYPLMRACVWVLKLQFYLTTYPPTNFLQGTTRLLQMPLNPSVLQELRQWSTQPCHGFHTTYKIVSRATRTYNRKNYIQCPQPGFHAQS